MRTHERRSRIALSLTFFGLYPREDVLVRVSATVLRNSQQTRLLLLLLFTLGTLTPSQSLRRTPSVASAYR